MKSIISTQETISLKRKFEFKEKGMATYPLHFFVLLLGNH